MRQPLQNLIWFDDSSFDAVIVAYGTHHIPPCERQTAINEAFRVLKPGGTIVLQDFEIGMPTTKWYDEVLDRYTLTGHRFEYFTRHDFRELLETSRFSAIQLLDVYDPFIAYGNSSEEARIKVLGYVHTLFALDKLLPLDQKPDDSFWETLEEIVRDTSTFDARFGRQLGGHTREFSVCKEDERFRAEIPRICLVATGRKPGALQ